MMGAPGDGSDGDTLSRGEYERLLDGAGTYRQSLVVRLVAEAGLRTAEIAELRPGHLRQVESHAVLDVPEGTTTRVTYLPPDLARAFECYVRSNEIGPDEQLVEVTPRRLSMLVDEVAEQAAERTGNEGFLELSVVDLRDFFAETLLVDERVDPRIVRAAGGWQSLETVTGYLDPLDESAIVDALASSRVRANDDSTAEPAGGFEELSHVLCDASAVRAIVRLDTDGYVERWYDATGPEPRERRDHRGRHLSALYDRSAVEEGKPEAHLSAARETGTHESEGWRIDADGERFRCRTVLSARRHDDGTPGYAMLVFDPPERSTGAVPDTDPAQLRIDVTDRLRTVGESLLSLQDRDEIERAACTGLADGSEYSFGWIATNELSEDQFSPTATAELEEGTLDAVLDRIDAAKIDPPWREALQTESVRVISGFDVDLPVEDRVESLVAVPLTHRETTYGVLVLAADRRIRGWERTALSTFGRRIGHAITAAQRRKLLLSDSVVELEFQCTDERSFFVDVTKELDCRCTLESIVPVSESALLFFVTLSGADTASVFDSATDHRGIDEFRLVETHDDGALLEFVVGGDSPLLTLTAYGGTITEAVFESGEGTIHAEIARDADPRTFVEGIETAFPRTDLVGKTDLERPVRTVREFREGVDDRLTDRQESSLQAAYYGGYFDWPRGSTAEEVADSMGVSSPTLHHHLRKGQHVLLETFFEGPVSE